MNRYAKEDADAAATIAQAVLAGDRHAEAQLVERYSKGVAVIGRAELGDDPSAIDDLVQETLKLTIERLRLRPLDDPHGLVGYIQQTARGLIRSQRRRVGRQKTFLEPMAIELAVDQEPTPILLAAEQQEVAILRASIVALPNPRDRLLLQRYYFEEREKESICAEFEITGEHLYRLLHRARKKLRGLLNNSGIDRNDP